MSDETLARGIVALVLGLIFFVPMILIVILLGRKIEQRGEEMQADIDRVTHTRNGRPRRL